MLSSIRLCRVSGAPGQLCDSVSVSRVSAGRVSNATDLATASSHVEAACLMTHSHVQVMQRQNATDITKPGIGHVSWIGRYCSGLVWVFLAFGK